MALRIDTGGEVIKFLTEPANPFTVTFWIRHAQIKPAGYSCEWSFESGDPGADTSGQLLTTTTNDGSGQLQVYDGSTGTNLVVIGAGTWQKRAITIGGTPNPM